MNDENKASHTAKEAQSDTKTLEKVISAQTEETLARKQPSSSYLLKRAAEDAYYLHSYSITAGKKIPEHVSKTIIEIKQRYDRGAEATIDPELEVRFSSAYRELAALMFPVTVESLRDTEEVQFDAKLSFLKSFRFSRAQQVAFFLPLLAILLILFILMCEIIQSIFIPGLRDIAAKEQKMNDIRTGTTDKVAIVDQSDKVYQDITAILKNLKATWENLPILPLLFKPADLGDKWFEEPEKVILVKTRLAVIVEVLNRLLPILYGALGATAYLLRVLIPHITDRTFNKKQAGSISVRICLGMLSGVAIQWFFAGGQQAQLFERSLSTSALAFLAGYSVDLLFNVMDRFVQGFKPLKETQKSE